MFDGVQPLYKSKKRLDDKISFEESSNNNRPNVGHLSFYNFSAQVIKTSNQNGNNTQKPLNRKKSMHPDRLLNLLDPNMQDKDKGGSLLLKTNPD